MPRSTCPASVPNAPRYGAATRPLSLSAHLDWPPVQVPRGGCWEGWVKHVAEYPRGAFSSWGVPFELAAEAKPCVIKVVSGQPDVQIAAGGALADYVCILHEWLQIPDTIRMDHPQEGLVVGEYELLYADGTSHVQPIRGRFEVGMAESPGPAFLAQPATMHGAIDPSAPAPGGRHWGGMQPGVENARGALLLYPLPNPCPKKRIASILMRAFQASPLFVAGITLYRGTAHPLRHLPRRTYRIRTADGTPARVAEATVDLGGVTEVERTTDGRGPAWLKADDVGVNGYVNQRLTAEAQHAEDLLRVFGSQDATVSVRLEDEKKAHTFSLGEAFHQGRSADRKGAVLEVQGRDRQWLRVRILDRTTGKPTPARLHMAGPAGDYIAPYGHHERINANWFEDYGADVVAGKRNWAYVDGDFHTELPVGDVYVEIFKGFEYEPVRHKVTIEPGQKQVDVTIDRWIDLRRHGWVTADTHVHFISPHTAWLEGQAEGVNVVNLLASQWGRLFTNVGDYIGRANIVENDTIVYVGTENRNHMLGHMSMLGTQGQPVYPMCTGGPSESYLGDPDLVMLAEWAAENRRKGGVVIRPHFPYCGHTEDPVPILKGLVDGLEIGDPHAGNFATQEWYRYLNCGYRVAVVGGTDKMGAYCALGWQRTYARMDLQQPLTYENWGAAVRAGRTLSTTGPLLQLEVDGHEIGDTIRMGSTGGTVEVRASARGYMLLGRLELVYNGNVIASAVSTKGARLLAIAEKATVPGSGWLAVRCVGLPGSPAGYACAHSSPVYVTCGDARAFDGPAAQHMLGLVEGGISYLNHIATMYDEASRTRMVKLFREARAELRGRLVVEAGHTHHHGDGEFHHHGHGQSPGHAQHVRE